MRQHFYPTMVEAADVDLSWIRGRAIRAVVWSDPLPWEFFFDDGTRVMVFTPWRILQDGRIAISCDDHAQQYGLPAPVDAVARARELLTERTVVEVAVQEGTLDLRVTFSSGALLEIIPFSCGYESWQITSPGRRAVVATGGGIATYEK
ncbi:MAG: DUF6188 family protein [Verrucomicrobiaceae bacterium]|nr:DUF6188 family protein [Verrucomicrobiaceae bacterium]